MTDKKEGEPKTDPVLAAIEGIAKRLESLTEGQEILAARVDTFEKERPAQFASMGRDDPRIGDVYRKKDTIKDNLFPQSIRTYQDNDVVRLRADSPRAEQVLKYLKSRKDMRSEELLEEIDQYGICGRVLRYMYTSVTDRDPKYRVAFPGIGDDGCRESELELATQS